MTYPEKLSSRYDPHPPPPDPDPLIPWLIWGTIIVGLSAVVLFLEFTSGNPVG